MSSLELICSSKIKGISSQFDDSVTKKKKMRMIVQNLLQKMIRIKY